MHTQHEDIRQSGIESLSHMMRFLRWVLAGLGVLYLASGIYAVSSSEVGMLLRFGRVVDRHIPPGIHCKLPWPFDRIVKVPVKTVNRILIDDFYSGLQAGGGRSTSLVFTSMTGLDSYCVTGDNNLVNVQCVIQYTIVDPFAYTFGVTDADILLRSMACSTIIHALGCMGVDDAFTRGKQAIAGAIKRDLQQRIVRAGCGIGVSFVEINDIKPPDRVQECFSDVVTAGMDYSKMINEAESYFNDKIPAAKAEAERTVQEASARKKRAELEARGETERFQRLRTRAARSGGSARTVLYIETLRDIFSRVGRTWLVGNRSDGSPPAHLHLHLYRPSGAEPNQNAGKN